MDDVLGVKENVKVTSIEPAEAATSDVVTVYGSGFGEDVTKVKAWVGQVPAAVVGVVPDMLMIEVPGGVRRGAIKIKVGDSPIVKSKQLLNVTDAE